jgi:hypothetical protein
MLSVRNQTRGREGPMDPKNKEKKNTLCVGWESNTDSNDAATENFLS